MHDTVTATPIGHDGPEYDRLPARVYALGTLMVLIGLATLVLMWLGADTRGSYLYLAFYSIPANTAISVFPHEPVLIYYGTFANLWYATLAASLGTLVAGWLDHRVFVPVLNHARLTGYKQGRLYQRMARMFMRYPFVTLLITGFTPIPFWPFKMLVFSVHYPLTRYLAALLLARAPRYWLLAWAGAMLEIPGWVLIGAVLAVFGSYAIGAMPGLLERWRRRKAAAHEAPSETSRSGVGAGGRMTVPAQHDDAPRYDASPDR